MRSAPDRVLRDDYEPLTERVAAPAPEWLAAIDHGLATRPEDRPADVRTWRRRLWTATGIEAADGDSAKARVTEKRAAGHAAAQPGEARVAPVAAQRQPARKKTATARKKPQPRKPHRRLQKWLRGWWPSVVGLAFVFSLFFYGRFFGDPSTPTFDITEGPSFATINLSAGFRPDTIVHEVLGGGSSDAPNNGRDCVGYTTKAPDARLYWTGTTDALYISHAAAPSSFALRSEHADATLLVNLPDGSWLCNDNDDSGLGPLVSRTTPRTPRPTGLGPTVWWVLKERFRPIPKPRAQRLAPLVRVDAPQEGQYDVWIGSHSRSPPHILGALVISEEANPGVVIYPRHEDG